MRRARRLQAAFAMRLLRLRLVLVAAYTAAAAVGCNRGGTAAPVADSGAPGAAASGTVPAPTSPPNALPIPSASVDAIVNPANLPAYDGPTGSVEGTVRVRGPEAPDVPDLDFKSCPAAVDTYGKLFRAGPPGSDGLRPVADAVVVVTGYSDAYIPARSEATRVVISANCGYSQRTIAMTFGQRLEVANDSKIAFAPLLSGTNRPAVMIAPPGQLGDPVKLYPPRPGHYMLGDQIQPFVREVVLVLRQPLHAVTDRAGHYRIDGVPTRKLKVGMQLEAIGGEAQKDVEVRASVVEQVDFVLTYSPAAAAPSPTDAGRPRFIP